MVVPNNMNENSDVLCDDPALFTPSLPTSEYSSWEKNTDKIVVYLCTFIVWTVL